MIERENDRADTNEALVNYEVDADSRRCFVAFFAILLLGGVIFSCVSVHSILQVIGARDWHEMPCVVVNSKVVGSSGHGDEKHRIEVLYMYEVDGRRYQSSRYEFDPPAWRASKQAVVDLYPPGKRTVCYVNPNDSREAVIERGFTAGMWWFLILGFLLVVIGITGILWQVKGKSRIQQNNKSELNKPTDDQLESFRQASCCFWGCFCMVLLGMLGIIGVWFMAYQLSSGVRSVAH